jgi:hypothetical protein
VCREQTLVIDRLNPPPNAVPLLRLPPLVAAQPVDITNLEALASFPGTRMCRACKRPLVMDSERPEADLCDRQL